MATGVVLLAAGSGRRFGRPVPKQFLSLNGEPLLMRPLRAFGRVSSIKEIVIVAQKSRHGAIRRMASKARLAHKVQIVEGGPFRGDSVRRGFSALSPRIKIVLVHDSARALVSPDVIRRVEAAVRSKGVAVAAWPLPDTLKLEGKSQRVKKTIPRKNLWLAQTPQGFKMAIARKCLLHPDPKATDDVQLAEKKGYPVALVLGSPENFKVTVPYDLKICRLLVS